MWGSVVLAIGAWAVAKKRYGADRPKDWEVRERALPGWKLLNNKYYVDEIYDGSVIRGVLALRLVLRDMDKYVVDGIVNAAGVLTKFVAKTDGVIDKYIVDGAVNFGCAGMLADRIQAAADPNRSDTEPTPMACWAVSPPWRSSCS